MFLSMGLASAIFGAGTGTVVWIMAAFIRMTLLGASGSSAADETAASVITANAVKRIDFMSVTPLSGPGPRYMSACKLLYVRLAMS